MLLLTLVGACDQTDSTKPPESGARVKVAPAVETTKTVANPPAETPAGDASKYCETAWGEIESFMKATGSDYGAAAKGLNKTTYLQACGEMPEGMQRCFSLKYAKEHREACDEERNKLTPEQVATMNRFSAGAK